MPDPKNIATLLVDGKKFTGFKSISVRCTYGETARSFQITCSDAKGEASKLLPGAKCVIQLGGKVAFTGWITDRGFAFDENTHDVVIAGMSLTTDLSASGMPVAAGNFNGYSAEQAIRGALAPHKLDLVVKNAPPLWSKPFPFLAANPGEAVHKFVERLAFMRGAFISDDEHGRLVVGNGDPKAKPVADLVEGRNLLRCSGKISDQSAVGVWNTYAQQPGVGDDYGWRAGQGQVTDPMVRQNRTVISHMPMSGDATDAATGAAMLAARAGWKTVEIEATVVGWFKGGGSDLWALTDNCTLNSPMALPGGANKMTLGTQAITFAQDQAGGTTTTLTLIRPEFLTPVGHASVASDGAGNIVSNPGPAQPVPPDYQGGAS
jgi:prophage tail gpP-like protein